MRVVRIGSGFVVLVPVLSSAALSVEFSPSMRSQAARITAMSRRAALIALLAACGVAVPALAASRPVNLIRLLAPQIAKAKTGRVAVVLPSTLAADAPASKLYAAGGRTARGYDIQLAYAPNCSDATACFLAEFWGNPGRIDLKTAVALAHGITGAYHGISCGASCAPATIQWKEAGVLYTIQWRAGTKASMIALANSAITAGPR
jgi:hypothetical protein